MMQTVPDNATCSAGAVVRQQEVKLQQQLVDLQSRFVEEQRKAIWVIFSHHLHSRFDIPSLFVCCCCLVLNLKQHVGQVQGTVWP